MKKRILIFFVFNIALATVHTIMVNGMIPYDVLETIQIRAIAYVIPNEGENSSFIQSGISKVNILVNERDYFSYAIYVDKDCTQELMEPLDFGSLYRGGNSSLQHLYIRNTGITNGTLCDVRLDNSGFNVFWGCDGSTTLHSGETVYIRLRLQANSDMLMGSYDFNILIDIANLSTEYMRSTRLNSMRESFPSTYMMLKEVVRIIIPTIIIIALMSMAWAIRSRSRK